MKQGRFMRPFLWRKFMSQVIVFKNPDGSCGIVIPSVFALEKLEMTIEEIAEKDVPAYRDLMLVNDKGEIIETEADAKVRLNIDDLNKKLPYRITDKTNIPNDRTFRNAWTDDNPTETVDVHIEKARDIHMNKIRELRNKKLEQLDLKYMRADEAGNTQLKQQIAAQKQALRDIPQNFDLATAQTPEELKELLPAELT